MSKLSKKSHPEKRQKKLSGTEKQSSKKYLIFTLIAVLAAIPFCIGKYFEFNFPGPYDSASNVYSAKHILEGAKIGVDEIPSAALGTLLVNMLGVWLFGFDEFGPKLIQGILQASSLILTFAAMRKLFGTLAAAISVIVASFFLSAPLIAKFGNVKEQFMITFMVIGVSCFVLRQMKGKWYWAVLAGAFVSWAPLFKETGASVIGGMGVFIIAQPLFKHRTFKQTAIDIALLATGAIAAIAPLYIWIIAGNIQTVLPYSFAWNTLAKLLPSGEKVSEASSYVASSRALVPFSQQWPRVLRYYGLLIVPIALATGSIMARLIRMMLSSLGQLKQRKDYDRFVLLFVVWWLLDMAFVWISPRSYEQYYLPLNASAAMLGGYVIALYQDKLKVTIHKDRWIAVGAIGLLLMISLSWHIFFGISKSPHTGAKYPQKRRGYVQNLETISSRRKGGIMPWEAVGQYIKDHSTKDDKIYVWGWYPGIYVKAQRFSAASKPCCLTRPRPKRLEEIVTELLTQFEQEKPKYIVDSRKRHIPTERPPYELWPIIPKGFMGVNKTKFLPLNSSDIERYDEQWSEMLRKAFDEDEALRYKLLKPLRDYVMNNYRIVSMFGQHVLFEIKEKQTPNQDNLE